MTIWPLNDLWSRYKKKQQQQPLHVQWELFQFKPFMHGLYSYSNITYFMYISSYCGPVDKFKTRYFASHFHYFSRSFKVVDFPIRLYSILSPEICYKQQFDHREQVHICLCLLILRALCIAFSIHTQQCIACAWYFVNFHYFYPLEEDIFDKSRFWLLSQDQRSWSSLNSYDRYQRRFVNVPTHSWYIRVRWGNERSIDRGLAWI